MLKNILLIMTSLLLVSTANADDYPPSRLQLENQTLTLNGSGMRSKFFLDLYIGALYLPQPSTDAKTIIVADEPMAITLKIVSSLITSEKMENAIRDGFTSNQVVDHQAIASDIEKFIAVFKQPIVKKDQFGLMYQPGTGVTVTKNNQQVALIPGLDFKKGLFSIWLGDNPAQESLKEEMLEH